MARPPWKPQKLLADLREQLEQTFAEMLHEPWLRGDEAASWQPAIDVYETADAYYLEADLPGVQPADVEVRLQGRSLTICGSRQSTQWQAHGRGLRLERYTGSFCRTIVLEHDVAADAIETSYEGGIYRLRLPKRPQ